MADLNLALPSTYSNLSSQELTQKLKKYCQTDPRCASTHEGGICYPEGKQHNACVDTGPSTRCDDFDPAALAFLDGLCGLVDLELDDGTTYGGGLCTGGFNWGPLGESDKIMQQVSILKQESHWQPGVNCAIDPKERKCKYNRAANADEQGDILYKNLQWDLSHACGALSKKEDCEQVETTLGMCAWSGATCVEGKQQNIKGLLPVCLSSNTKKKIQFDCAEEISDGDYCQGTNSKIIGNCFQGDCIISGS